MNDYTPEQIAEAKEYFRLQATLVKSDGCTPVPSHGLILTSALEAAEEERDALAAYAAKLEKAGDAMRRSTWIDFRATSFAWDAARKEKP